MCAQYRQSVAEKVHPELASIRIDTPGATSILIGSFKAAEIQKATE
jgi:hypothetical protein